MRLVMHMIITKNHAVGDPKTREEHLRQLRDELAEYKEGDDGNQQVTGGLLKNFTDENYQNALSAGQNIINATLKQLSETKYPDFDSFKQAREEAIATLSTQLQENVAYPELSEQIFKGIEELSIQMQLTFHVSQAEQEKEQLVLETLRQNVEQQKKGAALQASLMNTQQFTTNIESEKNLLAEQTEKQLRDWKQKMELEHKLREKQIAADLSAGFDKRANQLKTELESAQQQTLQMMIQMHKESMESQNKLIQFLATRPPPQPVIVKREPGLLTSLLGGLLGKLPLGGLLGGVVGGDK